MLYVTGRFIPGERFQVITGGDPLGQLAQVVPVQLIAQLRLSDEYDLQEFVFGRFEIREQTNLLQHVRA